jgi:hypothetical protein
LTLTAGIPYWRSSGELYFEVEICEAKGDVYVGFAGANMRAEYVGQDDKSWAIYHSGDPVHK